MNRNQFLLVAFTSWLLCALSLSQSYEGFPDHSILGSSNESQSFNYDEYFEYDENQTRYASNRTNAETTSDDDYRSTTGVVLNDYDLDDTDSGNESSTYNWLVFDSPVVSNFDLIRLRRSLLWMYDKGVRPVADSTKPIDVHIGVSIVQINSLDEQYQVITTTLQVSLRWYDSFIKWNQSVYNGSLTFR